MYNQNYADALDGIEQLISDLQTKLKNLHDQYGDQGDLDNFKYLIDDLEGFRTDDLVPTIKEHEEKRKTESPARHYLSYSQMGLRTGRRI